MNSGLPNLLPTRLARGLTQAQVAKAAGITRLAYARIENGDAEPKVNTLLKIAEALDVRLEDLLVQVPIPKAVRFRAQKRLVSRDHVLIDVARWLSDYSFLEAELNASVDLDYAFEHLAARLAKMKPGQERALQAAEEARELLDLSEDEPIRDICGLLESAGIRIYPMVLASQGFFGLSIAPHDGGPAIVVNVHNRISVERWIFSAAHELGHLLMHLDAYDVNQTQEDEAQEHEADVFASFFLMPERVFEREWEDTSGLAFVDRVLKVKRMFRVSYQTVLYRLATTTSLADGVWAKFQAGYRQRTGRTLSKYDEPIPLNAQVFRASLAEALGSREPEKLSQKDFVPERLARLVRMAFEKGSISLSRAAEILRLDLDTMRERAASWAE